MQNLTWNEYTAKRGDINGFRLTHYSRLFNSCHCRAIINDRDFILGWDDRYTTKEWNNQVCQMKKRHLSEFVEITPIVAEEIKVTLQGYQKDLVRTQEHLSTGLVGYEYNNAISNKQNIEKMIKIYSYYVKLLPEYVISEEDKDVVKGIIKEKTDLLNAEQDFYQKRILSVSIDLYQRILANMG